MEKITIKELAPYLPYKLQWVFEGSDDVHEVVGLDITDFGVHIISPYGDSGRCSIKEGKPLLRPLSQLTEEICHNGEKFVPIEEIAKIEAPDITGAKEKIHSITSFNRGLSLNSRQRGVTYKYEGVAVEITHYKDAVFHKKVINGNDSWVFSYFHNYPEILRKLHEWHFDVFGLIDRGIALPIDGKEVKL